MLTLTQRYSSFLTSTYISPVFFSRCSRGSPFERDFKVIARVGVRGDDVFMHVFILRHMRIGHRYGSLTRPKSELSVILHFLIFDKNRFIMR